MSFSTTLFRATAATALAAFAGLSASGIAAASELPDDLAFLDNETIDDAVAAAENGSADCAALSVFMGIGFVAGFAAMAEDEDAPTGEQFFAISAPVLVPLLHRASEPAEPAMAEFVTLMADELTGAIGELRDLGLTDDDLLFLQASMASELTGILDDEDDASTGETPPTTDLPDGLEERLEAVLGHDFESITFLDTDATPMTSDGEGADGDVLPWAEDCPETAAMFDFEMDPVEVSITLAGSIPIETTG